MSRKRIRIVLSIAIAGAVLALLADLILAQLLEAKQTVQDEGKVVQIESSTWTSPADQSQHSVKTYSLGTTADEVCKSLESIELNHKYIDDIAIYEMYPTNANAESVIFFIHGQGSRKEEYLYDMTTYAEEGYVCVTLDIKGNGERTSDQTIMSVQATVDTGNDINTLIEYYQTMPFANTNQIALVGLSQGGSVAYWYAAYGRYPLSALVVGSTTADYTCYIDDSSITNGISGNSIWTQKQLDDFIAINNPVNNREAFDQLPILSGHGMDDPLVPTTGDEEMEQYLYSVGNQNASFYYFEQVGHEVPEEFMQKVLPFVQKYLKNATAQ
jgi:pimeloyl-ACP methyl ester carboxylesterase